MKETKNAQLVVPLVSKVLPYLLLVGGIIGVLAAGILTVDKITLLQNPKAELACNINPLVSCTSVIGTPQASAFGFPNPIIGLVGFSGVAMIGAAMLAGATFKRWFWLGLQAGVLFGIGFVTWLQFQSIFVIGALCPWCMVVWSVMIPIFVYTTLHNIAAGHVFAKFTKLQALVREHLTFTLAWYALVIGVIVYHFWDFWVTLF